jgi:molybdopterin-guanine dinucleotide biosynthesis protein A
MAGEAQRFGYDFKPFLKLGDQTFIEHAVEPFYKWKKHIDKVYFIFRKDQEEKHDVAEYLKSNIDFDIDQIIPIIIPHKTDGPLQTVIAALKQGDIENAIICDCDHKINVDRLFKKIIETKFEKTIIPVWPIGKSESKNWSKIVIDDTKIINIVEKEDVDFEKYTIWGILGCIYFSNTKCFFNTGGTYISDVCRNILNTDNNLSFSTIDQAYFFGDVEMLENCINQRRNECSFFFDIDGVLLKHNDNSTNDINKNLPLMDNIKVLKDLKKANHKIILTTARSKKYQPGLISLLNFLEIPYDEIVTGLASGPRVLVNDRKPSKPFTPQANAIENYRNELLSLDVDRILEKNREVVKEDLSANSAAKTFLIEKGEKQFIRKVVRKNINDWEKHVNILKRQYTDLNRFNCFKEGLCPNTLTSFENNIEYYYDLEYLVDYQKLSDYPTKIQRNLLKRILLDLRNNVYCYNKKLTKEEKIHFFTSFIEEKIMKKLNTFSSDNRLMKKLISGDTVIINDKEYSTLKEIFNNKNIIKYAPDNISPAHGDLTLENILYNIVLDDYKLIDMDGSKLVDTQYLDLGKLSQSILSRYKEWNNHDINIRYERGKFICDGQWFEPTKEDQEFLVNVWKGNSDMTLEKAIFYMSTYFIRFTPFRLKKGMNHGIFALIMAVVWLNKLDLRS